MDYRESWFFKNSLWLDQMTPESRTLASYPPRQRIQASSVDATGTLFSRLADSHGVLSIFCKKYRGTLPESLRTRSRDEWTTSALLACELESLTRDISPCADWKCCL